MIDFERTLSGLLNAEVDFVIIGGFALYVRGSSQLTRDLDICYDRTRENIQRLVKAIEPYHPRLRGAPSDLPFLFDPETIRRGLNFTLTTDLGDLDLLGEVQGIGKYRDALARSAAIELFGRKFNVLSLEGLIASKRAAGRPRDLVVIPELEALLELESLNFGGHEKHGNRPKEPKQNQAKERRGQRG